MRALSLEENGRQGSLVTVFQGLQALNPKNS